MDPKLKEVWKYDDPHPDDPGLLLSDHIDELCQQGLLIASGYDPGRVRPASYTLTVGEWYVDNDGRRQRLEKVGDSFVFPKNSIVFVSTEEELDLPYYIVARFNLRVKWVYDGILLGTGPQVDPGFRGKLSCPLYNLTNLDITIKKGQEFATIDFEKTTSFLAGLSAEEKKKALEGGSSSGGVTVSERRYLLFSQKPFGALDHLGGHVLVSSLSEMRNEVRTWRFIGIGLVLAFLALTLSLMSLGANIYREEVQEAQQLQKQQAALKLLESQKHGTEKLQGGLLNHNSGEGKVVLSPKRDNAARQ